jgi:hypothetical protein
MLMQVNIPMVPYVHLFLQSMYMPLDCRVIACAGPSSASIAADRLLNQGLPICLSTIPGIMQWYLKYSPELTT